MKPQSKRHLPVYGVGPIYGVCIIALTITGIVLSRLHILPAAGSAGLKIPMCIAGLLIAAAGIFVWASAAFRIDKYITSNQLCTDGIYAAVRNPCYSGLMLVCTGALLIADNLLLLSLPLAYWGFLTVLMKHTEEKWLLALYGQAYLEYCRKVNRCIPWFPKNHA